jgi:hypothetical protein
MVEEDEGVDAEGIVDKVAGHVVEADRSCFTCWPHAQADNSVCKSSVVADVSPPPETLGRHRSAAAAFSQRQQPLPPSYGIAQKLAFFPFCSIYLPYYIYMWTILIITGPY